MGYSLSVSCLGKVYVLAHQRNLAASPNKNSFSSVSFISYLSCGIHEYPSMDPCLSIQCTNAVRCEGDYPIGCHIQVTFPPFNHWSDLETIINLDPFAVMERPLHIQKICIMQKFITALNRQTWVHGRIYVNATGQIRNEGHITKTVFKIKDKYWYLFLLSLHH
jgi:hypothetical protein